MPYQVQQLIEGRGVPVCVQKTDAVTAALTLMINNDFSQLPVVRIDGELLLPEGIITYEGIVQGLMNFGLPIEQLTVRDVMWDAPTFTVEYDMFDILDEIKTKNAVLVTDETGVYLKGIVTTFDTTEYLRERTEDLVRVEYVEFTVKELIKLAYRDTEGELSIGRLNGAADEVSHRGRNGAARTFEDLTLAEFSNLLLLDSTWDFFDPIFGLPKEGVKNLLDDVRVIRNSLAHFRGGITQEESNKLKFAEDWFSRCLQELEERIRVTDLANQAKPLAQPPNMTQQVDADASDQEQLAPFTVTEAESGGGRYAGLADWLQSQPGSINRIDLRFEDIEEITGFQLPPSARTLRAWWANDSVGHGQSQLWLDAGWRTTYINLTEGKVVFARMRERERAYIAFFNKLLNKLHRTTRTQQTERWPDGASWFVVQRIPDQGRAYGSFVFAFSRDRRFRVELYLDLLNKEKTKEVFGKLQQQRQELESGLGTISWERLDKRRASRIAVYTEGRIDVEENHEQLVQWGTETMAEFIELLKGPAEEAIAEAMRG